MRRPTLMFAVVFALHLCSGQTLREALRQAGIPEAGFSGLELSQRVDATSARHGNAIYLVLMRLDSRNELTGPPQALRFEPGSGNLLEKELKPGDDAICCGSPLGISVTRNYTLFEFHLNPSASAVIVADQELNTREILYGFGAQEVAPDEVIFTESMVHFAPAHAERIILVNLRTGAAREVYPPKGDALRAIFAREHKAKMPPQKGCETMGDPCDPDFYDEDVQWRPGKMPDQFLVHVSRNAAHAIKPDAPPVTVLQAEALYVYERRGDRWFYCAVQLTGPSETETACKPALAAGPEPNSDPGSFVFKVN